MGETNVVEVDADLSDLIPGFLAHKRADAVTIAAAVERRDWALLGDLSHKMKGEGGSYGLDMISELGAKLEDAAKVGDYQGAQRLAAALSAFLATVQIVFV